MSAMARKKPRADENSEDDVEQTAFIESQTQKINYDDSINTEDSINTVNTSETNISQPSQPVRDTDDNNGDSQLNFQYDANDHTTSFRPLSTLSQSNNNIDNSVSIKKNSNSNIIDLKSCLPPHVMVVPQELLFNENRSLNKMQSYSNSEQHELIERKANSYVNVNYGKSKAISSNEVGQTSHFVNVESNSSSKDNKLNLNAKLIKLPHPRHGQLVYFLVSSTLTSNKETSNNVNNNSESESQCKVYELHAQRTTSSFPLTWFINNNVIPSRVDYMYMTSPFNMGYFTLRILLESRNMCETNKEIKTNDNSQKSHEGKCRESNDLHYKDGGDDDDNNNEYDEKCSKEFEEHSEYTSFQHYNYDNRESNCAGSETINSSNNNNYNVAEHCFVSKEQLLSSFYQSTSHEHKNSSNDNNGNAYEDFTEKGNEYKKNNLPQMQWYEQYQNNPIQKLRKQEWHGWSAMAQNDLLLQVLLQEITSHTQLSKFCDYKCVSFNNANNCHRAKEQEEEYYYKFNQKKVVDWLVERINRLARSVALHELLHLPSVNKSITTNIISSAEKDKNNCVDECSRRNERQCTEAAFQLVMEYVDTCLHNEVAMACGLPCTSTSSVNNTVSSTKCKRNTTNHVSMDEDKENVFDCASPPYKKEKNEIQEMSNRQRQSAQKSASVKRLEKAGKPANTPTLFEMFASKNKSKK